MYLYLFGQTVCVSIFCSRYWQDHYHTVSCNEILELNYLTVIGIKIDSAFLQIVICISEMYVTTSVTCNNSVNYIKIIENRFL